jgi:hypothetical protein
MNPDSLIELYKTYLAAFNAHSLDEVKQCLAADCSVFVEFNGKTLANNRDEMLPGYKSDFEGTKFSKPVELLEIRAFENGVWTSLRNHNDDKVIEVEYYYNDEGLQIRHVIKSVAPFKTVKESSGGNLGS